MKVRKGMIAIFLLPCLLLFAFIYLAPIVMVFITSFFNWKVGTPMTFAGISNYVNAFSDANLKQSVKNTFIWVLLQSTVHVGIGTVLAFILSRKRRGWKIFRTIFMIPNVISAAALSVIFLNLFSPGIGVVNSIISAIVNRSFDWNWYFANGTAFFTVTLSWLLYTGLITILMLGGIQSVSGDILEAARIDGASQWKIDWLIILPLVRNMLGTAVIIASTSMLREFELIFLTTNGGPGVSTLNLPLYLYKTSLVENNYGYANMMGVVLIVVGVVIVFSINKVFRMDESDV
ncbi:MAG: carbohydrate ABC transporter permease [Acetanaerobacterium sp.]